MNPRTTTPIIVWGALLFSVATYLLVLVLVTADTEGFEAPDAETVPLLLSTFIFAGLFTAIGALFVRRFLFFAPFEKGKFETRSSFDGAYFTMSIITWAMSEAVAIFGFLLAIMTYELEYFVYFAVPSVLLLLFFRPTLMALDDRYRRMHPDIVNDPAWEGRPEPLAEDHLRNDRQW